MRGYTYHIFCVHVKCMIIQLNEYAMEQIVYRQTAKSVGQFSSYMCKNSQPILNNRGYICHIFCVHKKFMIRQMNGGPTEEILYQQSVNKDGSFSPYNWRHICVKIKTISEPQKILCMPHLLRTRKIPDNIIERISTRTDTVSTVFEKHWPIIII